MPPSDEGEKKDTGPLENGSGRVTLAKVQWTIEQQNKDLSDIRQAIAEMAKKIDAQNTALSQKMDHQCELTEARL